MTSMIQMAFRWFCLYHQPSNLGGRQFPLLTLVANTKNRAHAGQACADRPVENRDVDEFKAAWLREVALPWVPVYPSEI